MYTLRFIKHGGNGYKSFAAIEYEVKAPESRTDEDQSVRVKMTREDGEEVYEYVGEDQPFDLAYVTNAAGKTIDCIRHKNSARRAQ